MNQEREIAVVLTSGGMDSCVTVAIAHQTYEVALLHVSYGQRTWRRELKAFHQIADHYSACARLVVELEHFKKIGGSSLTDHSMPVPLEKEPPGVIPSTYVPFRNAHLVAIAVSWAEVIGARKIFIGVSEVDAPGYPDTRKEFYRLYNELIKVGTSGRVPIELVTPLIEMNKVEIVKKGLELNAPFHLTWSCYIEEEKACGRCSSCRLRLEGFRGAGAVDPIPYK